MKFKILLFLMVWLSIITAIEIVPLDTLYFDYLPGTATIDGVYNPTHDPCQYSRTFGDLTVRTCYYNKKLYFYFHIADSATSSGDYFYMGFDTNKDDAVSKGEPRIVIYRNGSVTNPGNWIFFKKNSATKSGEWQGEILVPFEDVGLPLVLGSGKSGSGPNIRLSAVDATEGSIGEFYGSGVGETYSHHAWSQPEPITVQTTSYGTPGQNWTRETDNSSVKMLEFSIATNGEEPFSITQLVFQGTGTGDEESALQKAELYLTKDSGRELIGSTVFTHNDGNLYFPVSVEVKGIHTGSNAPVFELYYVMEPEAGSIGGLSASFKAALTSVGNEGVYTNETLSVIGLPLGSGTLFTYDCSTDSGCADDEFCGNRICIDVIPGVCGYAANHIWNDYECCYDSDCASGNICSSNSCVEESSSPPEPEETEPETANETQDTGPVTEPPATNTSSNTIVSSENITTQNLTQNASPSSPNITQNNTPATNQAAGDIVPESTEPEDNTLLTVFAGAIVILLGAILFTMWKKPQKT